MFQVSVIGLGAMGASYAAKLHMAEGVGVRVIADGARAERLRRDGVTVNGQRHDFTIVSPGQDVEPADLMIVAVKYPDFAEALGLIRRQIGEGTIILSLLNGINSEQELAAAYPMAHTLLSITVGVDSVRTGQQIVYSSLGRMDFGEPRNTADFSEPVRRVAEVFDAAGLAWDVPPDMVKRLWWKFLVNTGVNQVTAVLGAPYAVVQEPSSPARQLMIAAQREVVAVAQARGVDLGEDDIDSWLEVLSKLGPAQYTSMAQDVLARRPTEAEIFSGAIMAMGAEHGIPVPVNTCLNQLLTSLPLVSR